MVRNKQLLAIILDLHGEMLNLHEEMLKIREELAVLNRKVGESKMTKHKPGRPKKQK